MIPGRRQDDVLVDLLPGSGAGPGGVAVKRLLKEMGETYGEQIEIVMHTGPGDPEWETYAINNVPALVLATW